VEVGRLIRCDADSYADDRERGDRHVDQQQDLPRCYREYEAAHRRPDGEPDQPYGRDEGDHTNAQAVFLEQPEGQRHRPWCGHRGRNPHRHSDGDELVRRGDKGGRQAGNAEQGQPDEHDPSPAEPIGDRRSHRTPASGRRRQPRRRWSPTATQSSKHAGHGRSWAARRSGSSCPTFRRGTPPRGPPAPPTPPATTPARALF